MSNSCTDDADVYRNKFGLTDREELRKAKYAITKERMNEIETGTVKIPGNEYGLDRLKGIHRHLLQDVYD
jgi:fido (protein-threonine AMPylation protein)